MNKEYINLKPTPQGMADMLLTIYKDSSIPNDINMARKEIIKAMTIAYAYWYPDDPEYHIDGIKDNVLPITKDGATLCIHQIESELERSCANGYLTDAECDQLIKALNNYPSLNPTANNT